MSIVPASLGQPLEAGVARKLGSLLGHDFSRVRVHRDAAADHAARSVDALAYTVGSDLVFAAGE
ncbi:MAG TPA: DUF4157 domain-containing protein, partial [Pyrinomonadaceae bacterium]